MMPKGSPGLTDVTDLETAPFNAPETRQTPICKKYRVPTLEADAFPPPKMFSVVVIERGLEKIFDCSYVVVDTTKFSCRKPGGEHLSNQTEIDTAVRGRFSLTP